MEALGLSMGADGRMKGRQPLIVPVVRQDRGQWDKDVPVVFPRWPP